MMISDGVGRGYHAEVDDENRLQTFSIVEPLDKHVNVHTGKVWSLPFTVTPVGPGDYFFYLKNTSTENYSLTDIRIDGAAADVVGLHIVSGTPTFTAGTDITPVGRNTGVTIAPTATIKSDTNTTGLTDDGEVYFLVCEANKMSHLSMSANTIIAPGGAIALQAATGTAALKCMVSLVGSD